MLRAVDKRLFNNSPPVIRSSATFYCTILSIHTPVQRMRTVHAVYSQHNSPTQVLICPSPPRTRAREYVIRRPWLSVIFSRFPLCSRLVKPCCFCCSERRTERVSHGLSRRLQPENRRGPGLAGSKGPLVVRAILVKTPKDQRQKSPPKVPQLLRR